jgi:hypothetical protein
MTLEEHKQRHVELHKAVDELFADYMTHHPNEYHFTSLQIIDLIKWSYEQTLNPTEKEGCSDDEG